MRGLRAADLENIVQSIGTGASRWVICLLQTEYLILTKLRSLETFLPFDMDAASTSTVSLLLAASIDPGLLRDHSPWSQRAYAIFDEMGIRGNLSARLTRSELQQLDGELDRLGMKESTSLQSTTYALREPDEGSYLVGAAPRVAPDGHGNALEPNSIENFEQHYELSPNQLMDLANSLDLNSLTWPFPSIDDLPDFEM